MPKRNGSGIALLADPTRLAMIAMIAIKPRRPSIVAEELGISRSAATRQLHLLRDAGLIIARRPILDRRRIVYAIAPLRHGAITAWLAGTKIGLGDGLDPPYPGPADPKMDIG